MNAAHTKEFFFFFFFSNELTSTDLKLGYGNDNAPEANRKKESAADFFARVERENGGVSIRHDGVYGDTGDAGTDRHKVYPEAEVPSGARRLGWSQEGALLDEEASFDPIP